MSERGRSTFSISQKARLEQAWSSGLRSTGRQTSSQISLLAKELGLSQEKVKVYKNVVFTEKVC
jgi:hypothetical protein